MKAPLISAEKPKHLLDRAIKIDFGKLLVSLGKFTVQGASGQWSDALAELPEAAAALGLEHSVEQRSWTLVVRATARAAGSILAAYAEKNPDFQRLISHQNIGDSILMNSEVILDRDIFDNPTNSKSLRNISSLFKNWLLKIGFPENSASALSLRLPSYIAVSLDEEWRSNSSYYQSISDYFQTPFSKASERELELDRYSRKLIRMPDEPLFAEPFSLRQVYVQPRAHYTPDRTNGSDQNQIDFPERTSERLNRKPVVFMLEEGLKNWLLRRNKDDAIRVISGGPGSGKSSFAKIFVSNWVEAGHTALLAPLHQIDTATDIAAALDDFARSEGLTAGLLRDTSGSRPILLVLDGLDELEMQGRAAQEASQHFANDLIRFVDRLNSNECKIQVIVGGRELSVQAAEGVFRKTSAVFHLIPYYISKPDLHNYIDERDLLDLDQRDLWWKQYGTLVGKNYVSCPKELTQGEIGDVTAQPLLNYLVALASERGDLKIDSDTNINSIYGDLLNAVHERGWAQNTHPAVRGISRDSFVRLLEEVAISVWHGDGRTATLKEVEQQCAKSRVNNLLPSLEHGASGGVSSLLMAFYFRQKGRRSDGDKTFEFTHKSFGEYLTALRISRAIIQTCAKLVQGKEHIDEGWTHQEALDKWLMLFGPSSMDRYLLEFVRREILVLENERIIVVQETLCDLYSFYLRNGWPQERLVGLTYRKASLFSRNAEEALLACINTCALVTKQLSRISWLTNVTFGDAVKRIQGQRKGPTNRLVMSCLSWVSAPGCCLDMGDFYGADLSNCDLSRSELNFVNFGQADLSNTNLSYSRLLWTYMEGAEISGADFTGSSIDSIIIEEGKIHGNHTLPLVRSRRRQREVKSGSRGQRSGGATGIISFIDPREEREELDEDAAQTAP